MGKTIKVNGVEITYTPKKVSSTYESRPNPVNKLLDRLVKVS